MKQGWSWADALPIILLSMPPFFTKRISLLKLSTEGQKRRAGEHFKVMLQKGTISGGNWVQLLGNREETEALDSKMLYLFTVFPLLSSPHTLYAYQISVSPSHRTPHLRTVEFGIIHFRKKITSSFLKIILRLILLIPAVAVKGKEIIWYWATVSSFSNNSPHNGALKH